MTPEEFTKTQIVNVIYDPNGMHILEEHVYGLMQKYADHQLILSGVNINLPNKINVISKGMELAKQGKLKNDKSSIKDYLFGFIDGFSYTKQEINKLEG